MINLEHHSGDHSRVQSSIYQTLAIDLHISFKWPISWLMLYCVKIIKIFCRYYKFWIPFCSTHNLKWKNIPLNSYLRLLSVFVRIATTDILYVRSRLPCEQIRVKEGAAALWIKSTLIFTFRCLHFSTNFNELFLYLQVYEECGVQKQFGCNCCWTLQRGI